MSLTNLWLVALGGLTLLLGLGAGVLKSHSYLPSEPIVALAVGMLVGPHGIDILQTTSTITPRPLLEQIARLTVAFAVTSIALRLHPTYYRNQAQALLTLIGPGMILMWLISALMIYLVLPVTPLIAMLIGAVVTPTDPVLANAIVVGETARENIPDRLRSLLSGEAGINDGTAYLFVFLPLLLITHPTDTAVTTWLTETLLWEVGGALLVGIAIGTTIGVFERLESSRNYLEQTSVFTITVALTIFVLGITKLAATDDILAVFVAVVAYNWQADIEDEADQQQIQEVFNRLFTIPVFVIFGMFLPIAGWLAIGWQGLVVVIGILLLRRLPMIVLLRPSIPTLTTLRATLFVGWFGPIGIAAVYYALLATKQTGNDTIWVVGSLVVVSSVLAHGITSTPATHLYGDVS